MRNDVQKIMFRKVLLVCALAHAVVFPLYFQNLTASEFCIVLRWFVLG